MSKIKVGTPLHPVATPGEPGNLGSRWCLADNMSVAVPSCSHATSSCISRLTASSGRSDRRVAAQQPVPGLVQVAEPTLRACRTA